MTQLEQNDVNEKVEQLRSLDTKPGSDVLGKNPIKYDHLTQFNKRPYAVLPTQPQQSEFFIFPKPHEEQKNTTKNAILTSGSAFEPYQLFSPSPHKLLSAPAPFINSTLPAYSSTKSLFEGSTNTSRPDYTLIKPKEKKKRNRKNKPLGSFGATTKCVAAFIHKNLLKVLEGKSNEEGLPLPDPATDSKLRYVVVAVYKKLRPGETLRVISKDPEIYRYLIVLYRFLADRIKGEKHPHITKEYEDHYANWLIVEAKRLEDILAHPQPINP